MNEGEKKAIKKFENLLIKHFEDKKIDKVDYMDYFEGVTILNLIEKQQKEIEEKEKVIDEMSKELVDLPIPISQEENILFFNSFDVKKFFYKKIKKK